MPAVTASPTPSEIDPEAQASADEAARKAKQKQESGVSADTTILTSGLGQLDENKKNKLG